MLSFVIIIKSYSSVVSVTGASDVGSGDYGSYITDPRVKDEDGFDIDDSDYDIFIEEVCFLQSRAKLQPNFLLDYHSLHFFFADFLSFLS